jgi:hypothetical protein
MAKKEFIKDINKLWKSIGSTNSTENVQDNFVAKDSKDDISILTNIISRMNGQGIIGKFHNDLFLVTYITYTPGLVIDQKDSFEATCKEIKKVIEDKFEEKTGRKLKLKEVGEDFDSEAAYTTFKQTIIKYTKFYEYK